MFEPTIRPADHWIDKVGIVGPDAEEGYKQSKTPRHSSKHMAVFPHALLHYRRTHKALTEQKYFLLLSFY